MPTSLDEFRRVLVRNILKAGSQEEVTTLVSAAVTSLEENGVNGHIILRFADKTIDQLDEFNAMRKDASQWSNIHMAKILFNRIKNRYVLSVV